MLGHDGEDVGRTLEEFASLNGSNRLLAAVELEGDSGKVWDGCRCFMCYKWPKLLNTPVELELEVMYPSIKRRNKGINRKSNWAIDAAGHT